MSDLQANCSEFNPLAAALAAVGEALPGEELCTVLEAVTLRDMSGFCPLFQLGPY